MTTPHLPEPSRVAAIIVAAGGSARMNGVDKTLIPLRGVPLIARTVESFEANSYVGVVVLMLSPENLEAVAALARERSWKKVSAMRLGGQRRQDTVRLGLQAVPSECEWVLVHDGARPLVSVEITQRGLEAACETGAAIAAVPVKDTIKGVKDGFVHDTLDRGKLVQVQTPQVFRRDLLERAHREISDDVTDDASMLERLGLHVRVFNGDYANIKVTTPEDLLIAEALLLARAETS